MSSRFMRAGLLAAIVLLGSCGSAAASTNPVPGTAQTFTYGVAAQAHQYIVYTPKGWTPQDSWPLIVMIHGCQTTAYQQMEANLYNPLADKDHFVVVYPDSDAIENAQPGPLVRCWQFFNPADWIRGEDDNAAVAAITESVVSNWNINAQRVYLMGMSAGSFLSADLAAEYPEIYAASGENAGGAYGDGYCLFENASADEVPVTTSAQNAFIEEGSNARVVPRIVIGGSNDQAVPPDCADKALMQGLRTDNLVIDGQQTQPISLTPVSVAKGQVPNGYSYTVSNYDDEHGCLIGQRWLVNGMNHFWSGGSSDPKWKSWTDPRGPSAAIASWNFFKRFTLSNTGWSCRPAAQVKKKKKR